MDPAEQASVEAAFARQAAVNERLEHSLQDVAMGMQQLAANLARLAGADPATGALSTSAPADLAPASVARDSPLLRDAPMSPPPVYSGDPAECRPFITQCRMVLEFQPQTYATDRARVAFIISRLGGPARTWATTLWEQDADECGSLSRFLQAMRIVFDQPEFGDSSADQLLSLRQGTGSTADYSVRFRTKAASSGWNEISLRAAYVQGLSELIRDELSYRDAPTTLDGLITLSIRMDNKLRARRRQRAGVQEDGGSTGRPRSRFGEGQRRGAGVVPGFGTREGQARREPAAEPMQLGRTRLSDAEKRDRRERRACFYCGDSSHVVRDCPRCPGNDQAHED